MPFLRKERKKVVSDLEECLAMIEETKKQNEAFTRTLKENKKKLEMLMAK